MSEPSPNGPTIPLEYAAASSRRIWRRRILRATMAILLLSIAICGYRYRAEISLRVHCVYWSHECLIHVTPPGTVLVETDPVKARALLASNAEYVDPVTYVPGGPREKAIRQVQTPQLWAEYLPKVWREYEQYNVMIATISSDDAVVFLGERRTPLGSRRLVVIQGARQNALALPQQLAAHAAVYEPATLFHEGQLLWPLRMSLNGGRFIDAFVSPGIADPKDPSHLSIKFAINLSDRGIPNRTGIIDVYLQDDNSLLFKVRDPATTQGL